MDDRCPACGEPLPDRPSRCFRCEADLGGWWRLDAAIAAAEVAGPAPPAIPPPPASRPEAAAFDHWHALLAVLVVVAALLGHLAVPRPVQAPDAEIRRPEPSPSPSPPPARTLRYRVQPGDSPWRIAAALTGRGERWPELFPPDVRLRAGTIVELPLPPP